MGVGLAGVLLFRLPWVNSFARTSGETIWWHQILNNIGSGNGLLPDGTKPLTEPILTSHGNFCGILSYSDFTECLQLTITYNELKLIFAGILKQNRMVVAFFPWYFTRRPAWKPRPRRGSGFHTGSPSEVSWKICNNKCGFVFIPRLYP